MAVMWQDPSLAVPGRTQSSLNTSHSGHAGKLTDKPPWNPPDWLFAPVWTLFYTAMALAAWVAWRARQEPVLAAGLGLWFAQLAANAAWSWLFFGRHRRPGFALADIGVLLALLVVTTAVVFHLSTVADWLLVPYGAWVAFAGCLKASLWHRNRVAA